MAKKDAVQVGTNVISYQEGTVIWFGIDLAEQGAQTEGSKGLDKKGNAKTPNELVGSTRSYVPAGDGRVLLHFIRPMKVEAIRKARAMRELDSEQGSVEAALTALKDAGIDVSGLGQ